jgi:UDP-N-acetylglucosamine 2-epimerase (non-hydrolysing)
VSKIIHLIAAARPNFMKIAPLYHVLCKEDWAKPVIVHTGQHYDINMSDAFFRDLQMPEPHIHMGVGSGTHAEQTGKVMIAYEKVVMKEQPDMVVVVGDVNSTIACTLAATKVSYNQNRSDASRLNRPIVAHLEAGLRSFDRTMPEEVNRLATDILADVLWTPSIDGNENLLRESVSPDKITLVGNIMIDSLEMVRDKIEAEEIIEEHNLNRGEYAILTLHRPANVDCPDVLKRFCDMINRLANKLPIIFPVHPRTRKNLEINGLLECLLNNRRIKLLEPQNYIRFMSLVFNCRIVITDSGGIQEETTYLGIPCFTLRQNTERPITITQGTNQLCTLDNIEDKIDQFLAGKNTQGSIPEHWNGKTAYRVVESMKSILLKNNNDG